MPMSFYPNMQNTCKYFARLYKILATSLASRSAFMANNQYRNGGQKERPFMPSLRPFPRPPGPAREGLDACAARQAPKANRPHRRDGIKETAQRLGPRPENPFLKPPSAPPPQHRPPPQT